MFKNLSLFAFALVCLTLQSALGVLLPTYPFSPNLMLPIVMFLGGSPEISLARGGLLSLVLGWALDEFCGAPMGLSTAVMVATYLASRGAVHQIGTRGTSFQIGLTFAIALLSGGSVLALRTIFAPQEAFPLTLPADGVAHSIIGFVTGTGESDGPRAGSAVEIGVTLAASAFATALLAPVMFSLLRRIETVGTRGRAGGETAPA